MKFNIGDVVSWSCDGVDDGRIGKILGYTLSLVDEYIKSPYIYKVSFCPLSASSPDDIKWVVENELRGPRVTSFRTDKMYGLCIGDIVKVTKGEYSGTIGMVTVFNSMTSNVAIQSRRGCGFWTHVVEIEPYKPNYKENDNMYKFEIGESVTVTVNTGNNGKVGNVIERKVSYDGSQLYFVKLNTNYKPTWFGEGTLCKTEHSSMPELKTGMVVEFKRDNQMVRAIVQKDTPERSGYSYFTVKNCNVVLRGYDYDKGNIRDNICKVYTSSYFIGAPSFSKSLVQIWPVVEKISLSDAQKKLSDFMGKEVEIVED